MLNLPAELALFTYELLPVESIVQVNLKYQVLVDMKCCNYFKQCQQKPFQFKDPCAPWFKNRICFFNKHIRVDYQLISLGKLEEMKYLWQEGSIDKKDFIYATLAADNGHLNMLKWLIGRGVLLLFLDDTSGNIARNGHLEVLKWMKENDHSIWRKTDMASAAGNGHLDVVKWYHEHSPKGCTTDAMDLAATNGHLDVVKFLHENRTEGCTTQAMDWAAASGHLDVVKWLHENRAEGCTPQAMPMAASSGHLHVIQWLVVNRTEGCTAAACRRAEDIGHLDIVKWLQEYRKPCNPVCFFCLLWNK